MKILYIHEYAFDHSQPGFTKPIEILSILAKSNHKCILISGMYSHITRKKLPKYKNKIIFNEKIQNINIIRVSGIFNLNGFIFKLLNHFNFMLFSTIYGLFVKNPTIIFASSPSPFAAFAGFFLSLAKRIPFVLEIRDLWPEDLIQEGFLKKGFLSTILEKLMQFLYKKADLIITVTNGIKDGIIKRNIKKEKVIFVPNSVNMDLFDCKVDNISMRSKLGLNDSFVILYAGNHGLSNALDKVIEAAYILKEHKDIKFLFIGSGEKKLDLIKMVQSFGLKNVIFLDPQPKNEMPFYFSASDVTIIPLKNVPIYEGALPNKLLDSMASSKPVLLAIGKEAKNIILEAQCGVCVEPENPEDISRGILELYEKKDKLEMMGLNGRKYIEENFSNSKIANKIEELLINVVAKKTN